MSMTMKEIHRVGLVLVVALAAVACKSGKKGGIGAETSAATVASVAPPPAPPPPETPEEQVDKLDFDAALAYAKPTMDDTKDEDSAGAVLFSVWASRHMHWTDVSVATDETTFALTQKDPDEARGKRLCTSGQIVQIEVEKLKNGSKLNIGLLLTGGGNIYRFITAGSSGTLVENSYARLCGVVTGKYTYSNSAGGTGHAVEVIGVFDLPANKPKK